MRSVVARIVLIVLVCVTSVALAAPSLKITKPPVTPSVSWTGPPNDFHAIQGQWFRRLGSGVLDRRTHEFYDNPMTDGGGWAGTMAIHGRVVTLTYAMGPGSPIMAFDIMAVVINDTPGMEDPPWPSGDNSHGEQLDTQNQYEGPLIDVKITAEFALSDALNVPPAWVPPYFMPESEIIATNHHQEAWYCWTPEGPFTPFGDFYVPTWDMGSIPVGQSATQIMSFVVGGTGMMPTDPNYVVLEASYNQGTDILLNRTTSLKISTWVDSLGLDIQVFPVPPMRSSDCSVFHNVPEPGCVLLALAGMAALRRR